MAHGHSHGGHRDADRGALRSALVLISAFMLAEVVAGLLASSLALLSDAAHMLTDAAALAISLWASKLAARPARGAMTYGLGRVEILSAQANGVTLLVLSVVIVLDAISRLVSPPRVDATPVLIVAIAGAAVNVVAARILAGRGEGRRSLNVEGSYRHILTDLYGFLATAVAAVVILATGFERADAVASLVISALMLRAAYALLKASGRVFMEAAPADIDPDEVGRTLAAQPGVVEVHDRTSGRSPPASPRSRRTSSYGRATTATTGAACCSSSSSSDSACTTRRSRLTTRRRTRRHCRSRSSPASRLAVNEGGQAGS
ncbi:MAG TPA: cation diffusion facilitator family transporter [Solirubrobacteraceae bacterium]|jgi:cobalt-zinc-cadmium efflux system protein